MGCSAIGVIEKYDYLFCPAGSNVACAVKRLPRPRTLMCIAFFPNCFNSQSTVLVDNNCKYP